MNLIPPTLRITLACGMALLLLFCTVNSRAEEEASTLTLPPAASANPNQAATSIAPKADKIEQAIPAIPATVQSEDGKNRAMASAVADGVTTGLALSAGAIETNPLIATSPVGLVALTGAKLGLVKYADTMSQEDKRLTLKSTSAVWGGAAVNNVMVLLAAPPPFPLLAGLIMGIATWTHMGSEYEKEDLLAAARAKELALKKNRESVTALVQAVDTGN